MIDLDLVQSFEHFPYNRTKFTSFLIPQSCTDSLWRDKRANSWFSISEKKCLHFFKFSWNIIYMDTSPGKGTHGPADVDTSHIVCHSRRRFVYETSRVCLRNISFTKRLAFTWERSLFTASCLTQTRSSNSLIFFPDLWYFHQFPKIYA